ncbi:hypothetical protein GCM10017557_57880 [Streptomyces aurantiacus]|uniref:Uncharacterized protein n=1 Tax=Streptomyces aurantiacus TaxID=47760 RepID=A0A7G1P6M7_9ACTN|nr:hypothetical protein GCM10017557_57880 [Streptomyces aurantiacus]
MLPQQQPSTSDASYRSIACRIGTHHACAESSPASAPIDVPVIYEACDCLCHPVPDCLTPEEGEPLSYGRPDSASTFNFDTTGGQTR